MWIFIWRGTPLICCQWPKMFKISSLIHVCFCSIVNRFFWIVNVCSSEKRCTTSMAFYIRPTGAQICRRFKVYLFWSFGPWSISLLSVANETLVLHQPLQPDLFEIKFSGKTRKGFHRRTRQLRWNTILNYVSNASRVTRVTVSIYPYPCMDIPYINNSLHLARKYIYVAGREVRIGKNCARGLE